MALSLEITQSDATVISKLLMPGVEQHLAQSGERFRVVDESGQAVDGLLATREGQNLVIQGLPESASLELSDFFEHCEDDGLACVLTMPDGQTVSAAGEAPLMLAQSSTATKTDAEAEKEAAVTVEEAAANPALQTSAIALGAIGAVGIAASVSGDNGDSASAPVTETPDTSAPAGELEGGDLTISALEATNGVTVTGTAEPNSVVVVMIGDATEEINADANGQYSATIDGASLPADGTYPVTVTSSGPGGNSNPETTTLGDVTIDTASGGDLSVTDASAISLTGFAGSDALVGGNAISVAGGDFNAWDFTGYNSSATVSNPASGLVYDGTTSGTETSIQFDTIPGSALNPGQPNVGWQVLADQSPGGAAAGNVGSVGRNGFQDGVSGNSSNFARIELITNSANPGTYQWETVTSEQSGGGGLTQTLTTVSGQTYSLNMDTVAPDIGLSSGHDSAGTSIEIRWAGETIAFFDATANGDAGAWLTSGGLVEPTGDIGSGTLTFSNLTANSATTELSIVAYESYGPATDASNDGVGLRISDISVSGAAGAADQVISGGAGSDLIYGQDGNDTLYGGTATTADTVTDVFVFSMQMDNGTNTIGDFDVTADRIALVDVRDADSTGTLLPGDTRANTGDVGGPEGIDGSATNESLTSAANIDFNDLLVSGEQFIGVTEDNGNTVLAMTGEGGASLGSVTLVGVTGQVGADDAASLNNLIGAGLLTLTSDPYSAQLQAVV